MIKRFINKYIIIKKYKIKMFDNYDDYIDYDNNYIEYDNINEEYEEKNKIKEYIKSFIIIYCCILFEEKNSLGDIN